MTNKNLPPREDVDAFIDAIYTGRNVWVQHKGRIVEAIPMLFNNKEFPYSVRIVGGIGDICVSGFFLEKPKPKPKDFEICWAWDDEGDVKFLYWNYKDKHYNSDDDSALVFDNIEPLGIFLPLDQRPEWANEK